MNFIYLVFTTIFLTFANNFISQTNPPELKGFTITGQIDNIPDGTWIVLKNISTDQDIDSAVVKDGQLSFSGYLNDTPEELRVMTHPKEFKSGLFFYTDLLMGNEKVSFYMDKDAAPKHMEVEGSQVAIQRTQYNNLRGVWDYKVQLLNDKIKQAGNKQKKQLYKKRSALLDSITAWRVDYVLNHFNEYNSLLTYLYYSDDFFLEEIKKKYKTLDPALKNSKYGKAIALQIKYPKPEAGASFYDFEAYDINQKTVKLSNIETPYILLQFGADGCYGSHLSTMEMKELKSKYKAQITFVSYFVDAKQSSRSSYVKENELDWLSLWTAGGKYAEPYHKYQITGTPTFYLLDTKRKVVANSWFGHAEGRVEQHLKEGM